jgi:hypothetical protein
MINLNHGSKNFWLMCWYGDNALNGSRELLFYYIYSQYE